MQAAVVPAVKARWEIEDVPTSDPGPNQVLIKIHASGLCYTDVHQTNGELPGSFPRTLGTSPSERSSPSGPVSDRAASETASGCRGFRPPAADANGVYAAGRCSVPTQLAPV